MSFSSPSVPTVPNPNITAAQQQQLNLNTLETNQAANQTGQITPTGSLTYTQTGVGPNGVPTYTATQTLSPAEQSLLQEMQGNQVVAGSEANKLLNAGNYGNANPAQVIGDATSGNTKALLSQETSYLSPFFNQQQQQLETQLKTQGIYPGNPEYDNQMMKLAANQNQAITGFLATAEPQAYQQAVSSYELPLETAKTLFGFSQPAGIGLTTTPQVSMEPANLESAVAAANQANMAAYNAQLNQQNAMLGGLFGLGSAAISGGAGGFGNSLLGSILPAAGAAIGV